MGCLCPVGCLWVVRVLCVVCRDYAGNLCVFLCISSSYFCKHNLWMYKCNLKQMYKASVTQNPRDPAKCTSTCIFIKCTCIMQQSSSSSSSSSLFVSELLPVIPSFLFSVCQPLWAPSCFSVPSLVWLSLSSFSFQLHLLPPLSSSPMTPSFPPSLHLSIQHLFTEPIPPPPSSSSGISTSLHPVILSGSCLLLLFSWFPSACSFLCLVDFLPVILLFLFFSQVYVAKLRHRSAAGGGGALTCNLLLDIFCIKVCTVMRIGSNLSVEKPAGESGFSRRQPGGNAIHAGVHKWEIFNRVEETSSPPSYSQEHLLRGGWAREVLTGTVLDTSKVCVFSAQISHSQTFKDT